MSGSAQAANLTGMLSQLANTVGGMGEAHNYLAQNIRDHAAPELDQNDPASMLKYAQWAQNNGQQDLAIKMQGAAAARTRQDKQTQGMAAMQGLRAQLEANRATLSKEQIIKIETQIAQIGANAGLTPEQMAAAGLRSDSRLDAGNAQANTVRGLEQVDRRITNEEFQFLQNLTLKERTIALAELTQSQKVDYQTRVLDLEQTKMENQVDQFGKTFGLQTDIANDDYSLRSWGMQLRSEMQDKEMEVMDVNMLSTELRDKIAVDLKNNTLSDSALMRLININTDERNQGIFDIQKELAPVRMKQLAADLKLTETQTQGLLQRVEEATLGMPDRLRLGAATADSAETAARLGESQYKFYEETFDSRVALSDLAAELAQTNINVLEFDMENRQDLFDLKEAWQEEQISASQLRTLYLGNADARAENLAPDQRRLLRAQVDGMRARTDMSIAQTDTILEALGFSKSTREMQRDAMGKSNQLLGLQVAGAEIGNNAAQRKLDSADLNDELIETNIKAINAGIELGNNKFGEQVRMNDFTQGVTLETLKQDGIRLGMEGVRLNAYVAQQADLMQDKAFQRQVLATNIMAQESVMRLSNKVYNSGMDVTKTERVANARKMFVAENGGASGRIFDEAVNVMRATKKVELELKKHEWQNEDAKPITKTDLVAMGMGEKQAAEISAISGNTDKNKAIRQWITKNNKQKQYGPPTQALLDVYENLATDMVRKTFTGLWGVGDGQWDSDVIPAAQLAMARAANSGDSDVDVMLAGHRALEQFAFRTDFDAKGQTIVQLRQAIEDR
jgi:hypothetical protein